MRKALFVVSILALASILAPSGSAAADVQDILMQKDDYVIGSAASSLAALDFTGPASQLGDVNFTWFRPDMSVAAYENVTPDSSGYAVSQAMVDAVGRWWINATYSGDASKYINRSMMVYDVSWSGITYAGDWIIVGFGTALTIEAGSEVRFANGTGLRVEGTLAAENVLFTSNLSAPAQGDWGSVLFSSLSGPGSVFRNNTVEYAETGVVINGIPMTIGDNVFRYGANGITLHSSSSLVWKNHFIGNALGVEMFGGSPTVLGNTFSDNSYGIRCLQSSMVTIRDNLVQNTGQTAVHISGSDATIISNAIQGGGGTGIYFADGSSGHVENTTVSGFTDGISARNSQPISIRDSSISSNSARNIFVYNANVTAINYTTKSGLSAQQFGNIYLKNYITVSANYTDGSKVANAMVIVLRDSITEISSFTGASGMTQPMLVLDRTVTGSGNMEHVNKVQVSFPGLAFAANSRPIDMSTSHTEYFVGSPFDNDGDGEPDFSDEDDDNDDLWDIVETGLGTNPFEPDTDGDGLTDGFEVNVLGSDPLVVDTDKDGYTDKEEYDAGTSAVNPENHPEDGAGGPDDEDAGAGSDIVPAAVIYSFQLVAFLMAILFARRMRRRPGK